MGFVGECGFSPLQPASVIWKSGHERIAMSEAGKGLPVPKQSHMSSKLSRYLLWRWGERLLLPLVTYSSAFFDDVGLLVFFLFYEM